MKERNYFGSRWGGDRICPNGPDEGTSRRVWKTRRARVRISKSDYLARRADSSEGRRPEAESKSLICGSRRFAVGFSQVSTLDLTLPELDTR